MARGGTLTAGARSLMLSSLLGHTTSSGFAPPQRLYVALLRTPALDSDTGTTIEAKEPVLTVIEQGLTILTGYERVEISTEPGSGAWMESGIGGAVNTAGINWPTPERGWGIISCWALSTGPTGGALVAYGELLEQVQVQQGNAVAIVPGGLRISIEQRSG